MYYSGLPGALAHGNKDIDELLIGNVLEASKFHEKQNFNRKGLKKKTSTTWQQDKEIITIIIIITTTMSFMFSPSPNSCR